MRKILLLFFSVTATVSFGQEAKSIDSLNYANIKIPVPENCQAKSEYELLDCNGMSIQWLYLNQELLQTFPQQLLKKFSRQPSVVSKSKIILISFGAVLTGYKFKIKNSGTTSYRIIASGTVNNQPLLLNIGTKNDLKSTSDLTGFLKKIITIK